MATIVRGGENRTDVEARHPWPDDCFVQGGTSGVVFTKKAEDTYSTAFVEAFPRNPNTFIRGEGETIEDAEDHAWRQYQKFLNCSGPEGHEFEPRGYTNGAGFCKHCGMFSGSVFTAEELGLHCKVCGVASNWCRRGDDFFCKEHVPEDDDRTTGSVLGDFFREAEKRLKD